MRPKVVHIRGGVYMIDAGYHGRRGVLGTYVVKGEEVAVVDPGPTVSIDGVVKGLRDLGIDLDDVRYVAPTHIHLDHAGGSWRLLELCPGARLYVHPRGAPHMVDPSRLEAAARRLFGEHVDDYGEIRGVTEERVTVSVDGEELDLGGGLRIRVVWTPGHASHHQSYYIPDGKVVILGDAGGIYNRDLDVVIPTSPPPFNPEKAMRSLEKLAALRPEIVCYGHFGFADDAVKRLRAHREQLALWMRVVEEGLKEGAGMRELYDRLRSEDPMLARLPAPGHFGGRAIERSPSVNLLGFVEYFKWLWRGGR